MGIFGLFCCVLFCFVLLCCCCLQAGIKDGKSHAAAKEILLVMGEFFQIQVMLCCEASKVYFENIN